MSQDVLVYMLSPSPDLDLTIKRKGVRIKGNLCKMAPQEQAILFGADHIHC